MKKQKKMKNNNINNKRNNMKRIFPFILAMVVSVAMIAQNKPLKVETFTLKNGLKVIMAEDHSAPKIYGAVLVHAGSKNEKPEATGVAHYFEHIMFKGTDRIGTVDWASEKVYLDSISQAYDRLHATNDEAARHDIQKEINRLNIAASKYAIPNEVDAILQKMGCTGLNAGTSYDYTVYYNTLPSNQLENWMDVYVERFRNPIFRLFQSELEAIYEEKNMYENQPTYQFSRNLFTESFGEHPYSRDVIGLGEHLKNPQPSEMQKFFETYYVANNMALLLVGDFNTADAKKLVEQKFSVWRSGELPAKKSYNMPKFEKQMVKEVKQTPIPMGIMVFPGIANSHKDRLALNMLASVLAGGSGPLDKVALEGRMLMAQLMPLTLEDAGSNIIMYVPKLVGQKHEQAEEIIWDIIDSVKKGLFDENIIEAIKVSSQVENKRFLESQSSIFSVLQNCELEGSSYEEWLKEEEDWMKLTKEDVMRVAQKYFDRDHCSIIRSKMGFPTSDGAVKPDWDHLEAQNQGAKSDFAQMIESREVKDIEPQVIDFKKDVTVLPINKHFNIYATKNPLNDIFELDINYQYDEMDNPDLDRATQYLNSIGAGDMDLLKLNMELDKLGGSIYIGEGYIHVSGIEKNIKPIMDLLKLKLTQPKHDEQQIRNIVDGIKTEEKSAKNSSDVWFDALRNYVIYGDSSKYLRKTPYKVWQKRSGEELVAEVMKMFGRNGNVIFVGNIDAKELAKMLVDYDLVRDNVEHIEIGSRHWNEHYPAEDHIYICSNKKFLQSDMFFYTPAGKFDHKDIAPSMLFNEYFGGGMNSIVFQEIREFRSLGYSTYGYFDYDWFNNNPAVMRCFLGTQCDKTIDGLTAMKDLVMNMPQRQDKLDICKEYMKTARNSQYIGFRSIPSVVCTWIEENHYTQDPRQGYTEQMQNLNMDDMVAFHKKYIEKRPFVVFISGNTKKIDMKELSKYGKVTEVKYKDMIRF